MGEVYRAFDPLDQRIVALKLLKPSSTDPERAILQFKQEFRVALSLRHENLVEVYDFGVADSRPYFTMELVEGTSLESGKAYPFEQVCDWLVQGL
ncbi:MAG: serine/threonine protein kinase, partial [Cyanobacteria bacterium REEB65]|nr:serine/threonine protein kinase [Cyanobacteria bacterium REEB65]